MPAVTRKKQPHGTTRHGSFLDRDRAGLSTSQLLTFLKLDPFVRRTKMFYRVDARDRAHVIIRELVDTGHLTQDLPAIRPIAVVLNTDPSHRPGEHWVLVLFRGTSNIFATPGGRRRRRQLRVEFFDSYGLPMSGFHPDIENFCKQLNECISTTVTAASAIAAGGGGSKRSAIVCNRVTLQGPVSSVCGHFVLLYILLSAREHDAVRRLIELFKSRPAGRFDSELRPILFCSKHCIKYRQVTRNEIRRRLKRSKLADQTSVSKRSGK